MNRKKVAIFGSSGQLGSDLVEVLGESESFEIIPFTHTDADCSDAAAVRKVLLATSPHIVINSAAFVRVDDCEDHPEEAFRVNAIGAFNIAKTCTEVDAFCVYVSTDYVFDGAKTTPYVESDSPCPINVYGASKLAGEWLVRQAARQWLIVRVASLFGKTGARGKGGNFIETILSKAKNGEALRIVDDIRISPTYTRHAAAVLSHALENQLTGVLHAANRGSCTWYQFAKTALEICQLPGEITPVDAVTYPTRARRPKNSALQSACQSSLMEAQVPLWQEGLRNYLEDKMHTRQPVGCLKEGNKS